MCANRKCLATVYVCDGDDDCGDGSDELKCTSPLTCGPNQLRCNTSECVPLMWSCDGDPDCSDSSDEGPERCGGDGVPYLSNRRANCTAGEFRCANGECVRLTWKCDGDPDCKDKSDESDCREFLSLPLPLCLLSNCSYSPCALVSLLFYLVRALCSLLYRIALYSEGCSLVLHAAVSEGFCTACVTGLRDNFNAMQLCSHGYTKTMSAISHQRECGTHLRSTHCQADIQYNTTTSSGILLVYNSSSTVYSSGKNHETTSQ